MRKRVATLETLRKERSGRNLHAPSLIRLPAPHLTPPRDPLPHSGHLPHNHPPPHNHSPPDCGILLPCSPPQNHSTPNTLGRTAIPWMFIINLLLFLQEQKLATAIYLFGLGTRLFGPGLKHMRLGSHHDPTGTLVTPLLLGRTWWSTKSPTCLPLSVSICTNDRH
jgi:hypothetical protein